MYNLSFGTLLVVSLTTFQAEAGFLSGISDGCDSEVESLVNTPREKAIFAQSKDWVRKADLIRCDDVPTEIVVAVHESIHFLDLGLMHSQLNDPTTRASLFLLDQTRLASPNLPLPSPVEVLSPFLNSDREAKIKAMLKDGDFAQEYILDQSSTASQTLLVGVATEINAYTHGALTAFNVHGQTNKAQTILSVQRTGIVFFLGVIEVYLQRLEDQYPTKYLSLIKSSEARKFLSVLVKNAKNVLQTTRVCDNRDQDEIIQANLVISAIDFSALAKVVGPEAANVLPLLRCQP